jgi:23S rRNA (uracil1939-C5)-methyltransferase
VSKSPKKKPHFRKPVRPTGFKRPLRRDDSVGGRVRDGRSFGSQEGKPVELGREVTLEISALTHTGEGVAHFGGYVLFLRGVLPGERVRAVVTESKRRYGRAEVIEFLHRSPNRTQPKCRHFGPCGRCSLQHLAYPEQLRAKESLLKERLNRALPKLRVPVLPTIPMTEIWGTRHKAHFAFGVENGLPVLGHFSAHTRELVPIEECPVHHPSANRTAEAVLQAVREQRTPIHDEESNGGSLKHLIVRASNATGGTLALLSTNTPNVPGGQTLAKEVVAAAPSTIGVHTNYSPLPGPAVQGVSFSTLAGKDHLIERVAGIEFLLSPTAFFQTNVPAAEILVGLVLRAIPKEAERVLDLYCGVGLFSLPLARRGHKVLGVEQNAQAVIDAEASAERNGIKGAEFRTGRTEDVIRELPSGERFPVVVLDPPRDGVPEDALRLIARRVAPELIVMVSCDPESLGRDLVVLYQMGYEPESVQPVDMFPHTMQIESMAIIRRRQGKGTRERRQTKRSTPETSHSRRR